MYDIRVGQIIWKFRKDIKGVQISEVVLSARGVTAGAYENHLLIYDLVSVISTNYKSGFFLTLRQEKRGKRI